MIITEQQKNQLNELLSKYSFNIISGNELTTEIVNQAKTDNGITPLYIAALNGHIEIVKALIEAGAEIDKARTNTGSTPLCIAAQKGHIEIVKELIKAGAKIDKAKNTGSTPLFIAAQEGHIEIVKALIEAGAEIDKARTGVEATPLYIAALNGHIEIAQALMEAGAEIDKARTDDGATPLYVAAQNGHIKIVKALMEAGAEIDKAETTYGATPLFIAAQNGHIKIVKALIEAGAEIDKARTNDGATPLDIAAHNGQLDVAQLLLFATKLSDRPDVRLTFSQTMNEDPIIRQILNCDQQGQFNSLRNNLNSIAQADKPGFVRSLSNNPNFFQNTETRNITTNQINTSQIVLKALYEHFSRGENLPELLETFTTKTTPLALLNRFNLNNPESLLTTLLSEVRVSEKGIPTAVNANIAEFAGAFSNKRLDTLLEAHFNGKEAKDLIKVAAETDKARALTQEKILAVENAQPDYTAELITKLKSLSSLPDNITENGDGTYKYHYDAENGAAELATKPLSELTESELIELNGQIETILSRQQAEITQDQSHAGRLSAKRNRNQQRGGALL